jgi:tetratricopeptide (TPR) repeat protein
MAAEPGKKPVEQQHASGGRDSIVAGGNVTINHGANPGAQAAPRRIWGGVPARNPGFKGREELLRAIYEALANGDRAVVQALHGMGGVGKTQIAIEYAHRFASDYALVWWINSERPEFIAEQFKMLATELGCGQEDAPVAVTQRAVLMALHERDHWLVIFDNAQGPEHVAPWLPGGAGHVVITSRAYGWEDLAVPVSVDVFTRVESKTILQDRVRGLSDLEADKVAEAVGDLPLAVAQAAGYIALTGIPASEYIDLVGAQPGEMLEQGKPWSYPRSLAAATRLSFEQLQEEDPAAAEVVAICAFLGPAPIPAEWFPHAASELPGQLGEKARKQVTWRQLIARLRGTALMRLDADGLVMHRMTQAIIRDQLASDLLMVSRAAAATIVVGNIPGDRDLPANWPRWVRFLPHLVALDPASFDSEALLYAGHRAAWYLCRRGDQQTAYDLARRLYECGVDRFGPDHDETLHAANVLGEALSLSGNFAAAREVHEDTLDRRRRILGEDNNDTLWTANNLAEALRRLGDFQAARELWEHVLARRRLLLGEDHHDTLVIANNLAGGLRSLGDFRSARELDEDTMSRYQRALGTEHPGTLISANNLASDIVALGDYEAGRRLYADVLARRRRVLGENDPSSLVSANNLAATLRALGEYQAARELDEDTLERRKRVLGEDHPDTRQSAENLAEDLRLLGENT